MTDTNTEREQLVEQCLKLGLKKPHPNIGIETLRARVQQALADLPEESVSQVATEDQEELLIQQAIAEANKPEKSQDYVKEMTPEEREAAAAKLVESPEQRINRKRREAKQLVRIKLTCMNPAKSSWDGEFITTGNAFVPTIKRFVPFNNPNGWHVERMILNQLKERKCQIWVNSRDDRGNPIKVSEIIDEFNIVELDPLTPEELRNLQTEQAMANRIGDS